MRRVKKRPAWYASFSTEEVIGDLISRIERLGGFAFTEEKRSKILTYAEECFGQLVEAHRQALQADDYAQPKLQAQYVEEIQDAIFLTAPAGTEDKVPLSAFVLREASVYSRSLLQFASLDPGEFDTMLGQAKPELTFAEAKELRLLIRDRHILRLANKYAEALRREKASLNQSVG